MECPIDYRDLQAFDSEISKATAEAMIATVWARARKLAPCLRDDDVTVNEDDTELVVGVVRAVVLRWHESGSGVVSQRMAGDYSETYKGVGTGGRFHPDEIRELQDVCRGLGLPTNGGGQKAYSVDTSPYPAGSPSTFHPFLGA